MKEFILASGNAHKASEFSKLFDEDVLNIIEAENPYGPIIIP